MDFDIENNGNDIVVSIGDDDKKSQATIYFEHTPQKDGQNIGCIGNIEINDMSVGVDLINKCTQLLIEKGIKHIVAPMSGNTWKKYRTMKYSNGDSLFLLENVDSIEYNELFKNAGFEEIGTYTSNKGLIADAFYSEIMSIQENEIEQEGITIRKFDKENCRRDLEKIYNISKDSFSRNPYYTPIDLESFIAQYDAYIQMVDEDFILICEKDGKEVAFVFCIPDFNELKEGKKLETLILKTIAVLPEYEDLAIGNILISKIAKVAKDKGFINWIFAFMYKENTSQKMAKRNKAEIMREYALYAKDV